MKKESITKSYIYNLIYQIIITIIPFLVTPYLTRILGANNLGIYSYTFSIVTIIYLFSALGINTYGQREIAYNQDNKKEYSKIFFELIIIRAFSTFLALILSIIITIIEQKYQTYYLIFNIYIIANLFDITWFYQGLEKFKTITIRSTIIKIIYLISVFLFIKNTNDLNIYILLFSLMTLFSNLSLWINIRKIINKPDKLEIKKHIKSVLNFFIPQIAAIIYSIVDKIMLGIIGTNIKEVSFYEQASYIVKTILMIITITNSIMVSKISYEYNKKNLEKIKTYLTNTINFIWIIGIPITFGICAVIKNFVPWFYGKEYLSVINLVYIMSPLIIIIGFNNLIGIQFLVSTKNQNKYILAVSIGAITNFILNLILIPKLNSIGATIASVISETIILLIEIYFFKKIIKDIKIFRKSLKYIIFGIIMFVVAFLSGNMFKSTIYGTFFQIIIGTITYIILLLISKDKFILNYLKTIKK